MKKTKQPSAHRIHRMTIVPLLLLVVGAHAQTASSAEALREALKSDLAPLSLSVKEHADAVNADMAQGAIEALAKTMTVRAPQPQLAARTAGKADEDRS